MAARLTEVAVDCRDPHRLAEFWCAVLDYEVVGKEDGLVEIAAPGHDTAALAERVLPPTLIFLVVPEGKAAKNRLHLDVTPVDRTREEEVERLLALGARHVDIGQGEQSWTVLADPEGNEFCVLRSLSERAPAAT